MVPIRSGAFRTVVELLDNAVDAVSVTGSAVSLIVREHADEPCVTVTASDNGCGLSSASATSLSGTFFVSTKGNIPAQIGTYGIGLKAVALWSHVEARHLGLGARVPVALEGESATTMTDPGPQKLRCGDIFLSSRSLAAPRQTLLVRASHSNSGKGGVQLRVVSATGSDADGQHAGTGTVVTATVPCLSFAALIVRLRAYTTALSLTQRRALLHVVVRGAAGDAALDWSTAPTPGGTLPLALAAGVSPALQAFQCTSSLVARGGNPHCVTSGALASSGASTCGSVTVGVALQFANRQSVGSSLASADGDTSLADHAAPHIPVTLLRLVNGAPLFGGASDCAITQGLAATPWAAWGLTSSGVPSAGETSGWAAPLGGESFDAAVACLRSVGESPAGCRAALLRPLDAGTPPAKPDLSAAASSMAAQVPMWTFRSRQDSWLVGIRFVVSVVADIGTQSMWRRPSSADRPVLLQFQCLRKRSLVRSRCLEPAVTESAKSVMQQAAEAFPALLRSALRRSHARIFDTILPGLSSSAMAVCRNMQGAQRARLLQLLHLDGQPSVTMEHVKLELDDALERFAHAMIHAEDAGQQDGLETASGSDAEPASKTAALATPLPYDSYSG